MEKTAQTIFEQYDNGTQEERKKILDGFIEYLDAKVARKRKIKIEDSESEQEIGTKLSKKDSKINNIISENAGRGLREEKETRKEESKDNNDTQKEIAAKEKPQLYGKYHTTKRYKDMDQKERREYDRLRKALARAKNKQKVNEEEKQQFHRKHSTKRLEDMSVEERREYCREKVIECRARKKLEAQKNNNFTISNISDQFTINDLQFPS